MVAYRKLIVLMSLLAVLTSCEGIFGGIYDEPVTDQDSRFSHIEENADGKSGTIYVDAHAYDRWTYIDLHHKTIDTSNIVLGQSEPHDWDFALHRYDAKTNNGCAAETMLDNVNFIDDIFNFGELTFHADVDSHVVIDMSNMMSGILEYAPSDVNPVLSRWMDVDLSQMPPIYTMSGRVYLAQFADSTLAALQFVNYMNESFAKGYITIRYRYPVNKVGKN